MFALRLFLSELIAGRACCLSELRQTINSRINQAGVEGDDECIWVNAFRNDCLPYSTARELLMRFSFHIEHFLRSARFDSFRLSSRDVWLAVVEAFAQISNKFIMLRALNEYFRHDKLYKQRKDLRQQKNFFFYLDTRVEWRRWNSHLSALSSHFSLMNSWSSCFTTKFYLVSFLFVVEWIKFCWEEKN